MLRNIKDLSLAEMETFFLEAGEKKFRASQVFQWVMKDVAHFSDMKNLPKNLVELLAEHFFIGRSEITYKQESRIDGTKKYLLTFSDGTGVEVVFMEYHHGSSLCISTQAGCRMGCTFCASGLNGLERNLSSGEMLEEILAVERDTGKSLDSLVLMGTGEPFDNYENVRHFLENLIHEKGLNLGQRHITISTSGLVPGILKFSEEGIQANLAVSLHNPFDEERSEIMPINRKYPIKELLAACDVYIEKTKRRVTFEYALINGRNDTERHGKELARLLRGKLCHVNLIPINNVVETRFEKSEENSIRRFEKILLDAGIQTTIRRELGADIDAACGQLRLKQKGN